MSKWNELKRLAEAATPGPWERGSRKLGGSVYAGPIQHWANGSGQCQIVMTTGAEWMNPGEMERNADFIAVANPAAILELIEYVESLEGLYRMHKATEERQMIELRATVDDLSALVCRLVQALAKAAPDKDLPAKAMDYLKRKGLQGSPLRDQGASK